MSLSKGNRPYYNAIVDREVLTQLKATIDSGSIPLKQFPAMNGIVEGKGVDNILLNETTASHIVKKYGIAFYLYDVNGDTIEMKYFMSGFSCFFLKRDTEMRITEVRLQREHQAFQKHRNKISLVEGDDFSLQEVFEYYRSDSEFIRCYDESYYVDFGFYKYHFMPPDYDGQDESHLIIDSITIGQSKSLKDDNIMVLSFIELKMSEYIEMYGQAECIKIMEKLSSSKLFLDNLKIAVNKRHVANANTISGIIHSSHYKFLLAPKRKIYFGSLFFLKTLYRNFEELGIYIDEYEFTRTFYEICKPFEEQP